jgi:hypothetical protein
MLEPQNTRDILAQAERAASTGDFVAAEELLRDAARRQEAELGPLHPDLANTLNNLAVAAEKSARLDDAETFYRRAVAIASASLQPDDPMVAASRQNLEDFCRAYGRAIDRPRIIEPPAEAAASPQAPPSQPPTLSPPATLSLPRTPVSPRTSQKAPRVLATLAMGVVGLVIVALFMARLLSSRQSSTAVPAKAPSPPSAAALSQPAPSAVTPHDRTPSPEVRRAPAATPAPGAIQLVTVQLCRSFSTSDFRCNPAGESVLPGPIVLYTRVRSPSDGVIVHQWYRGDALRKTARLNIGANEAEGYRTFSRQSVDRGDWRVEVRNAAGELLYEHRLAVR